MAIFDKKQWFDRRTDYYNMRRLLPPTDESGELITTDPDVYRVERFEGRILQEGDPWNEDVMNDMERRISNLGEDLTDETTKAVNTLNNTITSTKSELNNNISIAKNDLTNTINALDSQNVKLTGDQTKKGVLTLESIPVTTGGNPTSDNQLARKAYVDNAITDARHLNRTVTITQSDWQTISGNPTYYRKTTGITGISASVIPLLSLNSAYLADLLSWLNLEIDGGTIYLYSGVVPSRALTITVTLIETR